MRVRQRVDGDVVILAPCGRLDRRGVTGLGHALVTAGRAGYNRVLLNLGGVTRVDVSGLGALLDAQSTSRAAGVSVRVAGLSRSGIDLLVMVRLLTGFETFPSETEALASFRADIGRAKSVASDVRRTAA